jgi:hypothetical protein
MTERLSVQEVGILFSRFGPKLWELPAVVWICIMFSPHLSFLVLSYLTVIVVSIFLPPVVQTGKFEYLVLTFEWC